MLLAIVLDENKHKNLIDYINSFKKNDELIDYNNILIQLLNKGLNCNSSSSNIELELDSKIKKIIFDELKTLNNNENLIDIMNKTSNVLNSILDKLSNNNFNITNNLNNHNDNHNLECKNNSEYENYLKENNKNTEIKNVDINPLLANILNNANR